MYIYQVLESIQELGWRATFNEMIYLQPKEAVLMQKEVNDLTPLRRTELQNELSLISINKHNFSSLNLKYNLKNRYFKTLQNLRSGYVGYCLTKNGTVLGDLWCAFSNNGSTTVHPDVKLLGIKIGDKDVYGYDMYLSKRERGNSSVASLLLGGVLHDLKQKGYLSLKCYVMADRTPALWIHRVLGFKELGRCDCQRIIFYRKFKRKEVPCLKFQDDDSKTGF